jgi:hypothetical protein
MTVDRDDLRLALRLNAYAIAAILTAAFVVHVGFAEGARGALGFTFTGVQDTLADAWAIFANNARKLSGILALTLIVQTPWLSGEHAADQRPGWHRHLTTITDMCLIASLSVTFFAVAAGLGAYGSQMAHALLPHGPLEFASFSLAAVLYLRARRGPVGLRRAAVLSFTALALLAIAAPLETYL